MTFPLATRLFSRIVFAGTALCGMTGAAIADDLKAPKKTLDLEFQTPWGEPEESDAIVVPDDPMAIPAHKHLPVDMDAHPIVHRYKLNLNRPRRVIQDSAGAILIADWADGTIVKVDADGDGTLFASDLIEPAGLALDASGNLFVANHGGGMMQQGTIVKITPMGEVQLFADELDGPTALAFDAQGDLYVSEFHGNRILRITPAGIAHLVVDNIPTPAALAFDVNGYLYTASSTEGTVYRIGAMGSPELIARGLVVPSDLAFDPGGHLIATNFGGTELTYIDPMGTTKTFAIVPKGTIGIQFDRAGNLIFVNWDYQTLMKVTTNLRIPCPHCEKSIPVRLRPRQKSKPQKTDLETLGPII